MKPNYVWRKCKKCGGEFATGALKPRDQCVFCRMQIPCNDKRHAEFRPREYGEPCNALPGSPEKIEALVQRVANGLNLWHPDDCVTDYARSVQ